jgi:hypothetical protein
MRASPAPFCGAFFGSLREVFHAHGAVSQAGGPLMSTAGVGADGVQGGESAHGVHEAVMRLQDERGPYPRVS